SHCLLHRPSPPRTYPLSLHDALPILGLTPIAAFGGAFGSAMLVLAVSQRAGASRMTLILTGVALSSIFSAAVDLVVTLVPDALNGRSEEHTSELQSRFDLVCSLLIGRNNWPS